MHEHIIRDTYVCIIHTVHIYIYIYTRILCVSPRHLLALNPVSGLDSLYIYIYIIYLSIYLSISLSLYIYIYYIYISLSLYIYIYIYTCSGFAIISTTYVSDNHKALMTFHLHRWLFLLTQTNYYYYQH